MPATSHESSTNLSTTDSWIPRLLPCHAIVHSIFSVLSTCNLATPLALCSPLVDPHDTGSPKESRDAKGVAKIFCQNQFFVSLKEPYQLSFSVRSERNAESSRSKNLHRTRLPNGHECMNRLKSPWNILINMIVCRWGSTLLVPRKDCKTVVTTTTIPNGPVAMPFYQFAPPFLNVISSTKNRHFV